MRYCRSCYSCQKVSPKGKLKPAPLDKMPIISEPFSRVAIDIVGPFSPASSRGHKYILTLIDYATRYPEAVPLKNIDTISVAEALMDIFSRVGVPYEILSDNGTQFKSDLMAEIHRLLSIKALYTSPYHAACNGLVERLNGTLKSILKKLCTDHPQDWDRYIPAALFAYRELPNDTLKFSPFELLYGRTVRGPLTILHELWSRDDLNPEVRTTYQYVFDLRNKIEEVAKLAANNADISSTNYKKYYDVKAKRRKFNVNDQVLLLIPTDKNNLMMQWRGPYPVVECRDNGIDYVIKVGNKKRLYHINLLKKFYKRECNLVMHKLEEDPILNVVQTSFVDSGCSDEPGQLELFDTSVGIVNINPDLEETKRQQLEDIVRDYSDVFSDIPGKTHAIQHKINLTSDAVIRKKPFPVPASMKKAVENEVEKMLDMGIIEPSDSPYCSPVVLVNKSNNALRLCIDFRAINDITEFDAEPMPTREEFLGDFVKDIYFTELDLCKGYWQIEMQDDCKRYTAFATHLGLMQFKRMPFGLKTACSTFIRLMRKVTHGLRNVACYFDNLVVHNSCWEDHLTDLKSLLNNLRHFGLTAGPSKCFIGFHEIKYLGYSIGDNKLKPSDKIESILKMPLPSTKKQLRSFMGSVNFYHKFINNYGDIAAPLYNLLKKNSSNTAVELSMKKDTMEPTRRG